MTRLRPVESEASPAIEWEYAVADGWPIRKKKGVVGVYEMYAPGHEGGWRENPDGLKDWLFSHRTASEGEALKLAYRVHG